MDALRRARRPVRREFDASYRELEARLKEVPLREDVIRVEFKLFTDTVERLFEQDSKIIEQLVTDNLTEADENKEYDDIREYKKRAETIRNITEKVLPEVVTSRESVPGGSNHNDGKARKFKLPTIQMRKFSGEIKDWLGFWGQFQKIDQDPDMDGSDKFCYLMQCIEPGSEAYDAVAVYPPSSENYANVIAALKKQFANEDLQLQVCLRELLSLVITNVKSREKIPMKTLFLKLDSHLKALQTLNLKDADPATWLFPLVESCLPEKMQYDWQHSPLCKHDGSKDDPPRTRLDLLMAFVEREVEIKQRIDIARNFAEQHREPIKDSKMTKTSQRDRRPDKRSPVPALASFHAADRQEGRRCVFCERTNHNSEDCFKARNMSFEEKRKILRDKNRCYRCCGEHWGKFCHTRNVQCQECQGRHFTVLCKNFRIRKDDNTNAPARKRQRTETDNAVPPTTSCSNLECSADVALQTLKVKIGDGDKEVIVRAFMDSGSQRSYILKSTANKLQLRPKGMESVVHSLFGGQRSAAVAHKKYDVNVKSLESEFQITMELRENDTICEGLPTLDKSHHEILDELRRKNVVLSDCGQGNTEIGLLIGADMYARLCTGQLFELKNGPVALKTKLGWTLMGPLAPPNSPKARKSPMANVCLAMAVSDGCVRKLWELDVLGIKDSKDYVTSQSQDIEAKEKFWRNISTLEDGRYSVKLPWKEGHGKLPTNRLVAVKRLESSSRKLVDAGLFQAYGSIFKEWTKERFIEEVPAKSCESNCHYLPHRAVVKSTSQTTPIRPVFDASCHVGKCPSLNDCLITGDNLILLIPDLIQRFREYEVGIVSDIRKAFQQINVDPCDRDFMRFLWWKDENMKDQIAYRHARVMFGATCSPFILGTVIEHHLKGLPVEDKELGLKLLSTLYVDNCVTSAKSVTDYHEFRERSTEVMARACMDLRMWLSNLEEIDDKETQIISVLGLLWDRKADELFVNIKKINTPDKVTKRSVLSTVQKIFDPIGFTYPAILPIKLLLQRTWVNKLKWDQSLPEGEACYFRKWCEEVKELGMIRIPRMSTNGVYDRERWELHTFTDASKQAYSAVVFLRTDNDGKVSIQLLAAKSRVAPTKVLTIPKLELMGCLIGVRLAASVKSALRMEGVKETYWSDSATALSWIRKNDQSGTFIANRTKEIRGLSQVESWRYVPGAVNPADLPSRGIFPSALRASKWWEGMQWLYEKSETWPNPTGPATEYESETSVSADQSEMKEVFSFTIIDHVKANHSFRVLIRIVGWVRRFLFNFLVRGKEKRTGLLSGLELQEAEKVFIKGIQLEAFPKDQRAKLTGLELIEDDWGILRVKSRLTYRSDPINFKYPYLLPGKREEVRRLIWDTHQSYCHAKTGFLTTKLRKKYFILKTRRSINDVISKCYKCRRFNAKPCIPEAAPLPLDRVKNAEPFEVVGVDLAGPLFLKNGSKTWLVIFTCAVYRAVHFEVVKSCSAHAFIVSLSKFVKRYRRPTIIYSDNGTNFRGTDNLFRKLDWPKIMKDEQVARIEFKFNPVTAAWWGGWWERLIRMAKDLLKRTVGKGSLNLKELEVVVESISEVMNGRPLTYVSDDPDDLEPLTPSLFIHPFGTVNFPEEKMTEGEQLRFRLAYVSKLKEELKNRFLKEYLANLIYRNPPKSTRGLVVGELVLVGSDNKKRIEWPLGRVIKLIPGTDGVVRVAKVKVQNGEIKRPVQRLYPLEMDHQDQFQEAVKEKGTVTRSGRQVKKPARFCK